MIPGGILLSMLPHNQHLGTQPGTISQFVNRESNDEENANEPHKFTFPSHQFHILNLAKMCKENNEYSDVVIHVGDPEPEEELRAHRLVLGSVSPILKLIFEAKKS